MRKLETGSLASGPHALQCRRHAPLGAGAPPGKPPEKGWGRAGGGLRGEEGASMALQREEGKRGNPCGASMRLKASEACLRSGPPGPTCLREQGCPHPA